MGQERAVIEPQALGAAIPVDADIRLALPELGGAGIEVLNRRVAVAYIGRDRQRAEQDTVALFAFRQRLRALGHALLERLIQFAQLLLCPAALGHFGKQGAIGRSAFAVLAVQRGEDRHL